MTRVLNKSISITGMPNPKHVNNSILLAEQINLPSKERGNH
jgi:hypothetical protein